MYWNLFIREIIQIHYSLELFAVTVQLSQDNNTISYLSNRKYTKYR